MSPPLRWAPGDRCLLHDRLGVVCDVDHDSAVVLWPDETFSEARLDELQLVPESEPTHSSRTDLGSLITLEERP